MPAAMLGRLPRLNRQVCDRLHGGLTAKRLGVFLRCKMSLWGPKRPILRCNEMSAFGGIATSQIAGAKSAWSLQWSGFKPFQV